MIKIQVRRNWIEEGVDFAEKEIEANEKVVMEASDELIIALQSAEYEAIKKRIHQQLDAEMEEEGLDDLNWLNIK